MGYTRQLGQLAYLITFDGSGNITVPAALTQGSVTSSMLKTDSSGKLVAAVAGTDFVAPAGLSAYVPTTRTITINGTSYDLSADRSWSIVSGVSSFNTRTGAITLTSGDVTTALGYTPVTNARTLTINGTTFDLSADRSWSIVAGLSSFNTRTGAITLLDTDVTGALGYTPVTNARTITINGTTFDLSANRTWVVDASNVSTRVIQKFTATSSQTTFTITGGYTVGMVDVFLNGIKLDNATEFTASNGSTVVLALGAATGDIVEVYKYGGQFIANNTLRQSTLFTTTAGQTTFTVNYSVGFVDVFYNGSKLDSSEFTATNGTSIVLGTACVLNDKVEVLAYNYTVGAFTGVGGSGTTNYISKWTASGTLGNSIIFDNGTNVGIGTTTPTSIGAYRSLTMNGVDGCIIDLDFNGSDNGRIYTSSEAAIGIESLSTTRPLSFKTQNGSGSIERMTITPAGNIGINNTSPTGRLHINSNDTPTISGTNPTGAFVIQSTASTALTMGVFENNPFYGWMQMRHGNLANTIYGLAIQPLGGNVGIGTSSPTSLLTLAKDNNIGINTVDGTDNGYLALCGAGADGEGRGGHIYLSGNERGADAGTVVLSAGNVSTGAVLFRTGAGSERMRITNSGNVGIATNGPTFRLDVSEAGSVINGTATVGSNMKGIRIYNSVTATNNSAVGLWFSTGPHQAGIASFRATADSTWETSLAFYTHVNTTSNLNDATEKMRISGEGYVTKPSQPSFMASGNSGSISVSGGNVLVFNANRYNTGGHFNTGNGRFTAPVAGKYLFSWNIYYFGGYTSAIVLAINGSQYSPADVVPYVYRSSTDPEGTAGCTVQLDLSANDYVEVRVRASYGAFQIYTSHSHFAGHLLG